MNQLSCLVYISKARGVWHGGSRMTWFNNSGKKTRISWHGVVSVSGDETLPKTNSKFAPEK